MHDNYMTPHEVAASRAIGNRIARETAARQSNAGKPVNANAAIRHALATGGTHDAVTLAGNLLGLSHADASKAVAVLARTKPDDIVSPHLR